MTDYSRDRLGPQDEDRLPWLEPVEEELEEGGIVTGRLIIWLAVALLVVALAIGGFFWMRSGDKGGSGGGALIKAPDAYYKERPAAEAPATGDDEIVYSASKGNEVESQIDTKGGAETPVNVDHPPAAAPAPAPAVPAPTVTKNAPAPAAKPTAPPVAVAPVPAIAKPAAKPTPKPVAPKPVAAKPAPKAEAVATPAPATAPTSGGTTVQLGAFSSQAKATAAWKNLSGRFSFLAGLTQSVVPVQSGDKTLYRLRASGGNAGDICGRLRTAGETCSVVG